jgi:hypothetical protein
MLLALIVLVVTAALSRGGRHPRLLRGGIAFAGTSFALFLLVVSSPRAAPLTSGETYGIPLAVALVVGLVPWARLVPLMKYPSPLGLVVAWVGAPFTFAYPVPIYMTWRYATGRRPAERDAGWTAPMSASLTAAPVARAAITTIASGPDTTKVCPDCAEPVLAAARICRFCRYEFQPTEAEEPVGASVDAVKPEPISSPGPIAVAVAPEPSVELGDALAAASAAPAAVAPDEWATADRPAHRVAWRLLLPVLLVAVIAVAGVATIPAFARPGVTQVAPSAPAFLATQLPTSAPSPALRAGPIEFGTGSNEATCTITGLTNHYSAGDALYWAANYSRMVEASDATTSRLYVDGTLAVARDIPPSVGNCISGSIGKGPAMAGHYLLEYLVGTEVIARGEVDVLPR